MNVKEINERLARGDVQAPGLFPRLEALAETPFRFRPSFGLDRLPEAPGILLVRGARQAGKSTWLEGAIKETITEYGAGSAYVVNGDEIADSDGLVEILRSLLPLFRSDATVRRLFVDEITAVKNWERSLKLLADAGELRRVLVVTTGSKAADLRRGAERLPGRKGKLDRTDYWFAPLPYAEFVRVAGAAVGDDALHAYLLTGGSPAACAEIAARGRIPEYLAATVRDWIFGECAAEGRDRGSLIGVMDALVARGGSPVGQAALARAAGLANNTVAAGYIELLSDLMCVGTAQAWDANERTPVRRRPAKFPFINLLVASVFHPSRPRTAAAFRALPPGEQGKFYEWLAAQEIWRRAAVAGATDPERLLYWSGGGHEVDFVVAPNRFLEVKRGRAGPIEFAWFARSFPRARLTILGTDRFEAGNLRGTTFEDFLLGEDAP